MIGKCVIDWSERATNAWAVRLHRDLIALRREDPILARAASMRIDGAVLSEAFLVRLSGERAERLLVFNFGRDLAPRIIPDYSRRRADGAWRLLWSSEHPTYAGDGVREPIDPGGCWYVQGRAAFVLAGER